MIFKNCIQCLYIVQSQNAIAQTQPESKPKKKKQFII